MDLAKYQAYISAQNSVHEKILERQPDSVMATSMKTLGFIRKKPLGDELQAVHDYAIHECGRKGASTITIIEVDEVCKTDLEITYMESLRTATTSLFVVTNYDEEEQTLTIDDLLNQEHSFTLVDEVLSQKVVEGTILFLRPVIFSDIVITSKMALIFSPQDAEVLAKELHKREKNREKLTSKELFSFIMVMFKKQGLKDEAKELNFRYKGQK